MITRIRISKGKNSHYEKFLFAFSELQACPKQLRDLLFSFLFLGLIPWDWKIISGMPEYSSLIISISWCPHETMVGFFFVCLFVFCFLIRQVWLIVPSLMWTWYDSIDSFLHFFFLLQVFWSSEQGLKKKASLMYLDPNSLLARNETRPKIGTLGACGHLGEIRGIVSGGQKRRWSKAQSPKIQFNCINRLLHSYSHRIFW